MKGMFCFIPCYMKECFASKKSTRDVSSRNSFEFLPIVFKQQNHCKQYIGGGHCWSQVRTKLLAVAVLCRWWAVCASLGWCHLTWHCAISLLTPHVVGMCCWWQECAKACFGIGLMWTSSATAKLISTEVDSAMKSSFRLVDVWASLWHYYQRNHVHRQHDLASYYTGNSSTVYWKNA